MRLSLWAIDTTENGGRYSAGYLHPSSGDGWVESEIRGENGPLWAAVRTGTADTLPC